MDGDECAGHVDSVAADSPEKKARQLPRRMWTIVLAAALAWGAIIGVALLIFG